MTLSPPKLALGIALDHHEEPHKLSGQDDGHHVAGVLSRTVVQIDVLTYHYEGADQRTVLINCHYPIDANFIVQRKGIVVEKSEYLPEEQAIQTAVALGDFVKMGFEQDVAIWRSKARIDNPLLVEEDGPVYHLRRWYEQFYVDMADVTADMVDRFEFELDTTRPGEAW